MGLCVALLSRPFHRSLPAIRFLSDRPSESLTHGRARHPADPGRAELASACRPRVGSPCLASVGALACVAQIT